VAVSVFAIAFFALIISGFTTGAAHAHAFHESDMMQSPVMADEPSGSGGNLLAKFSQQTASECEIECCSPAHCASGLAAVFETAFLSGAAADAFILSRAVEAIPFDQSDLKRPPRG
jgi:hypothetical protein